MADSSEAPLPAVTTAQAPPRRDELDLRDSELSLVVVCSPDASALGRSVRVQGQALVVGRDVEGMGLQIRDPLMSRVHFRVAYDRRSSCHRIGDSRSRNGTFVEGERIDSALLRPFEIVRAGDTLFVLAPESPLDQVGRTVERVGATPLSVLVLGETGSGKELVARSLHEKSGRSGPFVAVNCAALPRQLLEAELFGHTKGAFSGATQARDGLFQTAHCGTLFLDEIGDFPLDLQAVLLRALEQRAVRPVGSDQEIGIDVRVVAATHCDLDQLVKEKRFRADLFARLAQTVVRVPPLRERKADILRLASEFAAEAGERSLEATPEAAELLLRWHWPFNVRELKSLVAAFAAPKRGEKLDVPYLREHHPELARSESKATHSGAAEKTPQTRRDDVEGLLRKHQGNVSAVAKDLGKPRAQIYRWLRSFGLSPTRYR